MENNDLGDLIIDILSNVRLSDKAKLLAELYYFDNKSYNQIAEETGFPLGTIKANLFRFREVTEQTFSKSKINKLLEA